MTIYLDGLSLFEDPQVYTPQEDSLLLAKTVRALASRRRV